MAAKKSKTSQIQKDANKLLADAEKNIQKQAGEALKGIRKLILSLAKQTEKLEKKLERKKKTSAGKKLLRGKRLRPRRKPRPEKGACQEK